jgi:uncharacterized delta-60 repeat protein
MKSTLALSLRGIVSSSRQLAVVFAYSLIITLTVSMLFSPALAQQCTGACFSPGCLDAYFGNCGTVLTDTSHHPNPSNDVDNPMNLLVQEDGKLIATGVTYGNTVGRLFAAARYNVDGTLDNTFGQIDPVINQRTGVVVTTFTYQGSPYYLGYSANGGALQKVLNPTTGVLEERLIQIGQARNSNGVYNIAVLRYTPEGDLDTSFNNNTGSQLISFGSTNLFVNDCTIHENGTAQAKIIIAGGSGSTWNFIRLNADGTLDTSFGTGGKATVTFSNKPGDSLPWRVTMQQTTGGWRILAVGRSYGGGKTGNDFALVRLNLNGSLDPTFGTGGIVTTDFSRGGDQARDVAIDPATGDIIAAGDAQPSGNGPSNFGLARYDQNGNLRSNFGSGGKVMTDMLGNTDNGDGVAIQWDGKIVVAGGVSNSNGNLDFGLARYSASGALDSMFGTGGKVIKDFAGSNDLLFCMALQTVNGSQRIVVGGSVRVNDVNDPLYGYNFGLARFLAQ